MPKHDPKATLTERLAANLKHLRLSTYERTQGDMAKKLGISTSYLSMLERGGREPSLTKITTFTKRLKLSDPLALFR
jgi:transcriptional regulator with XRE-family HTH domain